MRISDWSSDVCSSDLLSRAERGGKKDGVMFNKRFFALLFVLLGLMITGPAMAHQSPFAPDLPALVKVMKQSIVGIGSFEVMRKIGRASCRERVVQYG